MLLRSVGRLPASRSSRRSRRPLPLLLLLLAAAPLLAAGCAAEDTGGDPTAGGTLHGIVPEGKADNYFSDVGQEYTVTGRTSAVRDAACLERHADALDPEARCQLEAVGLKNFAIGWFLNQYVIDKHDAKNEDWGGFTAMTRPESYAALESGSPDAAGRFDYTFTSELSGPLDLLSKLPTEACADDASARCFTLEIPVLDPTTLAQLETGSEWYRKAPYNAYAPELYTGEKEALSLRIAPYPRSNDAFLEYGDLFDADQLAIAGGKLRIGVFVGWDYYDDRYDLQTAREVYRWLTEDQGFASPVDGYDAYRLDSGELTKTIRLPDGREVPVEVVLVHPGQGDPADPTFAGQMKDAMKQAFTERQVVIYEGHAGPLYGFALADWNKTEAGELDDSELPLLDIPSGFYQVVLASGCDTYMVADALYKIPVKAGRVDLDVVTTSSFSNAAGKGRTAKAMLTAVLNQRGEDGALAPQTWGEILRELNRESWMTPLFGVHGIDDNPRDNPFADKSLLCAPCESDADCGGEGNLCVLLADDAAVCTTLCKTDADCTEGNRCFAVYTGDTIVSNQCAPSDLVCDAVAP